MFWVWLFRGGAEGGVTEWTEYKILGYNVDVDSIERVRLFMLG